MHPRRRFGKLFWFSLTTFTLILITMGISARFGFGFGFPGGNITIANGRIFMWRWGKPDFEPFNPYERLIFDQFPPSVVVVHDTIAFQYGLVSNVGLEGTVYYIGTPIILKLGAPQPVGIFLALWPFAAICFVPVGLTLVRLWRQKACDNHCRKCGYDLTANTSGRCPECGENM